MTARLWTALLLLAGIVAMHGLQCTSATAHGSAAAPAPGFAGAVAMGAPLAADGHITDATVPGVPDPMAGDSAVTGPRGAAPTDAGYGTAPSGAAHLWTLCLAALAAGIAVLLAVLAPRLVRLAAPALRRAYASAAGCLAPPRPPDLSALCLLRI
jgi:hypothetical protein